MNSNEDSTNVKKKDEDSELPSGSNDSFHSSYFDNNSSHNNNLDYFNGSHKNRSKSPSSDEESKGSQADSNTLSSTRTLEQNNA